MASTWRPKCQEVRNKLLHYIFLIWNVFVIIFLSLMHDALMNAPVLTMYVYIMISINRHTCVYIYIQIILNIYICIHVHSSLTKLRRRLSLHLQGVVALGADSHGILEGGCTYLGWPEPQRLNDGNPTCYQVTGMMKYSWKANLFPARLARFLAKKTVEHIVWRSGKKTLVTNTSHTTLLRDMWRQTWYILMFQIEWSIFIYIYIYNMNICEVAMLMPPAVANAITSKSCLNSHFHVSIPHSHGRSWKHHWTEHGMADTHTHRAGLLLLISNAIKCKKYESTSKIPHMNISNLSKQNVITIKNSSTLTKQHNIQRSYHQHDAAWHSVPVSQHRHQTWHHSPSSQLVCLHEIRH